MGNDGHQSSSAIALALDTRSRESTTIEATYGAASRTNHPGNRGGGGAPKAVAIAVNTSRQEAGRSSTTL